jgi:hypothetical protein
MRERQIHCVRGGKGGGKESGTRLAGKKGRRDHKVTKKVTTQADNTD